MTREATVARVHLYLDLFDALSITVWIGGGWGVDALLDEQTRPHADNDIVVSETEAQILRKALLEAGFGDIPRDDTRAWNFVMGEPGGSEIDFHVIVLDDTGDGIYGPAQNVDVIPREARASIGYIGGREVRCRSAEYQIRSHFGYQLKAKDIADVAALRYRFGIP